MVKAELTFVLSSFDFGSAQLLEVALAQSQSQWFYFGYQCCPKVLTIVYQIFCYNQRFYV